MIRSLVTFILGLAIGIVSAGKFSDKLNQTPDAIRDAANSLGLNDKIPESQGKIAAEKATETALSPQTWAPPPQGYASTGPLAASLQAEAEKRYDDALSAMAAYQQAGGDPFVVALRSGWLQYLRGAYPDAEQAYVAASRIHPTALNPVIGLLNLAEASKDETKIQRAAEAIVRLDPANYRANMTLGRSTYATRDYRGTFAAYRRLLTIYPDDVDARSGIAWAAYYTGDTHEAYAQFKMILATYPDYPNARDGYNLVAVKNGAAPAK